jgi:hypothetical protein
MDFVAQIGDPRLVELYRYWEARRSERFAPPRSEIHPTDIPKLLPYLLLIDVLPGPRCRYRLVGTEVERVFGAAMTGRCTDELMHGEYLDFITGLYRAIVEGRTPVYSENTYSNDAFRTHRLMLPLSEDGEIVTMVLAGQVFLRRSSGSTDTVFITQDTFRRAA